MIGRSGFDFFFTGFWLGTSQVALAFHLLYSQGASVIYYFALIALWLSGSVVALAFVSNASSGPWLKAACLVLFLLSALVARADAFSTTSLAVLLLAVISFGVYAGWFLRVSVGRIGEVRRVMLHENNGFILGYALSGMLLFYSVLAIDLIGLVSGLFLCVLGIYKNRK